MELGNTQEVALERVAPRKAETLAEEVQDPPQTEEEETGGKASALQA